MPSVATGVGQNNTWLGYVCNRGVNTGSTYVQGVNNGSLTSILGDSKATGVCLNQSGIGTDGKSTVAPVTVGQDYISSHDGTTTTLLLSESLLSSVPASQGGLWYPRDGTVPSPQTNNEPLWMNGNFQISLAAIVAPLAMEVDTGFEWGTFNISNGMSPQVSDKILSNHSGGCNVLFCDGHQQFLNNTISIPTFIHLMTPYDKGCPQNVGGSTTIKYCNVPDSYLPDPTLSGAPSGSPRIPLWDVLDEANL